MERKLTAIFSADVQGYSRLMGEDEEATIRTLTAYREIMTSSIRQHRGRVVDSPGDNLLAEFASAVDAVQAAVTIQKELKTRNEELPPNRRMAYRIGINVGDVVVEGERIYGDGVNIAARVESLADGGGICISGTAYDQIENKLALSYEYIGEQTVKNIAKPVRAYKVQLEPGTATTSTMRSALPTPSPIEKKITSRRWLSVTLAVVAVVIVGAGVILLRNISQPPPSSSPVAPSAEAPTLPLPDSPSVAVLPFTNMSDDPEQEYFSDGMTDDLITDLSRLSGLLVIARHSVFAYKGKTVNMKEVSRELGVRYVLEGSVRRADAQVRINAQLIDATTGYHVWAERYDRELKDIFALQNEIMQKIVRALEIKLTKEEQERFRLAPTENLEAYDDFLRGWEYFWHLSQKEMAQARQVLEKAVQLDPQYAGAHALLSTAYLNEFVNQWDPRPQTLERAFELAQKAVALDDSLALAHHALGVVYPWKKQMDQAISELERAIALDPNYANAYAMLADTLNWAGRPEEAIGLMKKAMRLNPHYQQYQSWYTYALGNSYRLAGQNEEAITTLKRSLIHNPSWWPSYIFLAVIYGEQGQEAEARAAAAEVLRINPSFSLELGRQTWPYKDPAQLERDMAALRKAGLK
jgi:adenylate cyclase